MVMTIKEIVKKLNRSENKIIHKIYSKPLGVCHITSKNSNRYKLTDGMDEVLVNHYINLVHKNYQSRN